MTVEAESEKEETHYNFVVSNPRVKNVPALGDLDILRAVAWMPGIAQTNDLKGSI